MKILMNKICNKCGIKNPGPLHIHCPKCGSPPSDHELRNYSMMWHEGDIHCVKCETFVRSFDAG